MIENFRPLNLESALAKIRTVHPVKGSDPDSIPSFFLTDLQLKLSQCPREEIPTLVPQLIQREIRGCFVLAKDCDDDDVADKALEILFLRPKKSFLDASWRPLFMRYQHHRLESLVRFLWKKYPSESAEYEGKNAPKWVGEWLKYEVIPEGMVLHYQPRKQGRPFDQYLQASLIREDDGLFHAAWARLLCYGTEEDLLIQPVERLLIELKKLQRSEDWILGGQNYLLKVQPENWSEQFLIYIHEKHGNPADPSERDIRFWKDMRQDVIQAFQQWLIIREIEIFFGKDERSTFWRGYAEAKQVVNIRNILSRKGFMLDFGKFGVIEFKEFGNAAYVYPTEVFKEYWERDRYSTSAYKSRSKAITRYRNWDGRIVHTQGWQDRTRIILKTLFKDL